jgi:hypothetical protein
MGLRMVAYYHWLQCAVVPGHRADCASQSERVPIQRHSGMFHIVWRGHLLSGSGGGRLPDRFLPVIHLLVHVQRRRVGHEILCAWRTPAPSVFAGNLLRQLVIDRWGKHREP